MSGIGASIGSLEIDGVNPNLFYILSKESKRELQSCRVNIPLTVLFEQGFAKAVFTTEPPKKPHTVGEIKHKAGKDVDLSEIFEMFARNSQEGDIVATLMFAPPRSMELSCVRFMDRVELKRFLFVEVEKPKGLLQQFVRPKGTSNSMIHAVWSPLMVLTEGRRCHHSLTDRHLPVQLRAATFEDPKAQTTEVLIASATVKQITATCQAIATHFERLGSNEKLELCRLGCYFKVDEKNTLQFLCSTSMRFVDHVTHTNVEPVSLSVGLRTPQKEEAHVAGVPTLRNLQSSLDELDAKTRKLRAIGIPSMPDTSTLLQQNIQFTPEVAERRRAGTPSVKKANSLNASRGGKDRSVSPSDRPKAGTPAPTSVSSPGAVPPPTGLAARLSTGGGFAPPPALASPMGDAPGQRSTLVGGKVRSPNGSISAASPQGSRSPPHPQAPTSPTMSSQQAFALPGPRQDPKVVSIGPMTPMPQPHQLMHYQHLLPNSNLNLDQARKAFEIGRSEDQLRDEWQSYLREQEENIIAIRTYEDQLIAEKARNAQNEKVQAAVRKIEATEVPPLRYHSTYDEEMHDATGQEKIKSAEELAAEEAASLAQVELAKRQQQSSAVDDKAVFMQEVRNAMGRKALQAAKKPGDGDGMEGTHDDDAGDLPRIERGAPKMPLPGISNVPRSVLLPPTFLPQTRAIGSLPGASDKQRRKSPPQHGKMASPAKGGAPPTSPSGPVLKSGAKSQRSPKPEPVSPAARNNNKKQQQAASPKSSTDNGRPPSQQGQQRALGASATSIQSMQASTRTPPTKHLSIRSQQDPTVDNKSNSLLQWPAMSGTNLNGERPEGTSLSNTGSWSQSKTGTWRRMPLQEDDFVNELKDKRSRAANIFTDFEGLDADEVMALNNRTASVCQQFRLYVEELVYSAYTVLLTRHQQSVYVEIPDQFTPFVSVPQLAAVLHKLHPVVVNRVAHLTEHCPRYWRGDLVEYRNELVRSFQSELLKGDFPCDEIETRLPPPAQPSRGGKRRSTVMMESPMSNNVSFEVGNGANALVPPALQSPGETGGHLNVSNNLNFSGQSAVSANTSFGGSGGDDGDLSVNIKRRTQISAVELKQESQALLIPLLQGRGGFSIMRSESNLVAKEADPFLEPNEGSVFHQARKHLYFVRLAEIEGEALAAERRRLLEEAEAAAAAQEVMVESNEESQSLAATTRTLEASVRSISPMAARTPVEEAVSPLVQEPVETLQAPKNHSGMHHNVVCKRCQTCVRVCCVCSLVFSPSKHRLGTTSDSDSASPSSVAGQGPNPLREIRAARSQSISSAIKDARRGTAAFPKV